MNHQDVVVHILQGLLASGYYTEECADDTPLLVTDKGDDWKEYAWSRYTTRALSDALDLAGELETALEWEIKVRREDQ